MPDTVLAAGGGVADTALAQASARGQCRARTPVLVVGSVALDRVETAYHRTGRVIGRFRGLLRRRCVAVGGCSCGRSDRGGLSGRPAELPVRPWCRLDRRRAGPGGQLLLAGRYNHDFSQRKTLDTRLGVFGSFDPEVPAGYRDSEVVLLANIDPVLQLNVLRQMRSPRLVAADTMNFWIERRRGELEKVLGKVDVLFLNDDEARQLTSESDLSVAAQNIRAQGPEIVVIKKGRTARSSTAKVGALPPAPIRSTK